MGNKVKKVLAALVLATILFTPISYNCMSVALASETDADKNIVVSEKDNSIRFIFSEEGLFFENYPAEYVIIQDSEVITFSQNYRKKHLFRSKYGLDFSPVAAGTARVLMVLSAADGRMEEALLYDISIDEDNKVTYEKLEHFVPSYAARKGVAYNTRKLMKEDYGFSDEELNQISCW